MKRKNKILVCLGIIVCVFVGLQIAAFADGIGDAGGTGQGNIGGNNVYTFSYIYDSVNDAIELRVDTKYPLAKFGNTTSHTFKSLSDQTVLHTNYPVCGNSIEKAIASMNTVGGYKLSATAVKAELNKLGFYDKGNGVWKYDGGYLTYVSAIKIRPQVHTVTYDANGGSGSPSDQKKTKGNKLFLSNQKPICTGYTFKYWRASIGGNYNSGQEYKHDQDGGTVTMKAYWKDDIAPSCSSFVATPNTWSAGNGTVSFVCKDQGTKPASVTLERYSYVTHTWSTVKQWAYNGTAAIVSGSYTEYLEGVFSYKLTTKDKAGNSIVKTSAVIYLDHSNPVMTAMNSMETDWTNVATTISVSATDYLSGNTYGGSGLKSIVIKDDLGNVVARGTSSVRYTLNSKDEGVHTWYIVATDNVGHTSSSSILTKYDITKPGMDGTEITNVQSGGTYFGYCQDDMISQHIDDELFRSINHPNSTSGLESVMMYKVKNGIRTAIGKETTQKSFNSQNTHSAFDLYYDISSESENVDYYLVMVKDYAGNIAQKKLVSQKTLLKLFHTSIDRSSY